MARRSRAALALAAVALLVSAAAGAALSSGDMAAWRDYIRETAASAVGGSQLGNSLQTVLTHAYSTPLEAVQASNAYTGANARLRRVVSDLAAGKPVKVVAIGGPATNGSDASQRGRTDYLSRYVAYLSRAFPGSQITFVRASAGVAPSAVVAACADKYIPPDADLVLLELAANDGAVMDTSIVNARQPKAYEMLVRRIMGGTRQPALVLTQARARRGAAGRDARPARLRAGVFYGRRGWSRASARGGLSGLVFWGARPQRRSGPTHHGPPPANATPHAPNAPPPSPPTRRPCPRAWATARARSG
jgi:hypothetical protein